jgi:hypothetical protein
MINHHLAAATILLTTHRPVVRLLQSMINHHLAAATILRTIISNKPFETLVCLIRSDWLLMPVQKQIPNSVD